MRELQMPDLLGLILLSRCKLIPLAIARGSESARRKPDYLLCEQMAKEKGGVIVPLDLQRQQRPNI
jgi:hypothetical protein